MHSITFSNIYPAACAAVGAGLAIAIGCCVEHAALAAIAEWRVIGGGGLGVAALGLLGCSVAAPRQQETAWLANVADPENGGR